MGDCLLMPQIACVGCGYRICRCPLGRAGTGIRECVGYALAGGGPVPERGRPPRPRDHRRQRPRCPRATTVPSGPRTAATVRGGGRRCTLSWSIPGREHQQAQPRRLRRQLPTTRLPHPTTLTSRGMLPPKKPCHDPGLPIMAGTAVPRTYGFSRDGETATVVSQRGSAIQGEPETTPSASTKREHLIRTGAA